MIIEGVYWLSVVIIIYAYFGYPVLLWGCSKIVNKNVDKKNITPNVSFIITAYNEEDKIEDKLKNTLEQIYPKDKIEIIVASDCSSDKTDEIVQGYASQGVSLIRLAERKGKEFAQKAAITSASGEIVIFSDAATKLDNEGVINIVSNFNDSSVGCVSSEDIFISENGEIAGEGAYVRYEMFLRKLESNVNTLVGLSGSFFATRKAICSNFPGTMQSDFYVLLESVRQGYRGVTDSESKGYYKDISSGKKEFSRKVRTVLRGITVFFNNIALLNPLKYGFFSFQLLSHKLLRWLVPVFMVVALITNIMLFLQPLYKIMLGFQVFFYLLALIGFVGIRENGIFKIPMFFIMVNSSIFVAWLKFFSGERVTLWEPSKR